MQKAEQQVLGFVGVEFVESDDDGFVLIPRRILIIMMIVADVVLVVVVLVVVWRGDLTAAGTTQTLMGKRTGGWKTIGRSDGYAAVGRGCWGYHVIIGAWLREKTRV